MTDDTSQPGIDWLKTVGGALAAVSTAVLLSTLGAAGTLIGAALGSVAVTVTTQLYTQGLARSRDTMAKAQEAALTKVGIAQTEVRRAGRRQDATPSAVGAHLENADEQLAEARSDLHDGALATPGLRDRLVLLPWKRIALLAVLTFVVVLAAIGVFEKLAGRSVASYTGGSDRQSGSIVPGNGDGNDNGGGEDKAPARDDKLDDGTGPSDKPSPSEDADPTGTPTTTAPTASATPTPTPTPSSTPTPTPTPSPSAAASPTR